MGPFFWGGGPPLALKGNERKSSHSCGAEHRQKKTWDLPPVCTARSPSASHRFFGLPKAQGRASLGSVSDLIVTFWGLVAILVVDKCVCFFGPSLEMSVGFALASMILSAEL